MSASFHVNLNLVPGELCLRAQPFIIISTLIFMSASLPHVVGHQSMSPLWVWGGASPCSDSNSELQSLPGRWGKAQKPHRNHRKTHEEEQ